MNNYIPILKEYQDKVYVYNVLCVRTYEYYTHIKTFINIPLILSSSCLSILNASFDAENMKIANIVASGCTALMISLINNFKVAEKSQVFRNLSLKYIALLHEIEHKINSNAPLDSEDVRTIVIQYDDLLSQNEYVIPEHIKRRVKKLYQGKKSLPVIINDSDSQPSPPPSKEPSASATDNFVL